MSLSSYVFCDGQIQMDRLTKLRDTVGKEHLVLDLKLQEKRWKVLYCDRPLAEVHKSR